jgi:hypothetical protein
VELALALVLFYLNGSLLTMEWSQAWFTLFLEHIDVTVHDNEARPSTTCAAGPLISSAQPTPTWTCLCLGYIPVSSQ